MKLVKFIGSDKKPVYINADRVVAVQQCQPHLTGLHESVMSEIITHGDGFTVYGSIETVVAQLEAKQC